MLNRRRGLVHAGGLCHFEKELQLIANGVLENGLLASDVIRRGTQPQNIKCDVCMQLHVLMLSLFRLTQCEYASGIRNTVYVLSKTYIYAD